MWKSGFFYCELISALRRLPRVVLVICSTVEANALWSQSANHIHDRVTHEFFDPIPNQTSISLNQHAGPSFETDVARFVKEIRVLELS